MHIPRILITAPASGTGKTLVTCGILQVLKSRGMKTAAFKCGPDYIDPMFHREVLGIPSYNLDTFLCGKEGVRNLLVKNAKNAEIAVLEGVMGYYDGLAGISTEGSAYDVADTTDTPAILVVDCKGVSVSVVPYIQGFLHYRAQKDEKRHRNSHIAGVILNRLSPMMYGRMKQMIEEETDIKVLGYVPVMKDCVLESRHLGLKMPGEVDSLQLRIMELGKKLEETIDIDGLLEIARRTTELTPGVVGGMDGKVPMCEETTAYGNITFAEESGCRCGADSPYQGLRIGVAKDEAFCFMYQDNLDLIESMGVRLIPFSPISDKHLPERLDGLLLYGGYPELYADRLSQNESMRMEIREAIENGLPCIAECGGFMYLQESITDEEGHTYPMVGALKGKSYYTPSLKRFGYITLSGGTKTDDIAQNGAGVNVIGSGKVFGKEVGEIPAHEFHYYDSDECGSSFTAKKPLSQRSWKCIISTETLLAGYPHIHYYGNLNVIRAFLDTCRKEEKE